MNIFLQKQSSVPLYEQIKKEIKTQIISGELRPNESLPSMRLLAEDLNVSLITTKRAYDDLLNEGFLYSISTRGCFVAELDMNRAKAEVLKAVNQKIADAVREANKIDLSFDELADILKKNYKNNKKTNNL